MTGLNDLTDVTYDTTNHNLDVGQKVTLTAGATHNTFVGELAGATAANSTSNTLDNTALGYHSMQLLTSGFSNTAVGSESLEAVSSGGRNTAVGAGSMVSLTTGNDNVCVGCDTMIDNLVGGNNVIIGSQSSEAATGSNNTIIGGQTALGAGGGQALTTGSGNILIGAYRDVTSATVSNTLNIGDVITATGMDVPSTSIINLAGNPTTTTQSAGDNSTKIATTAYADKAGSTCLGSDYRNLKVVQASNTTATVTWDELVAKTALAGTAYLGASGSFTLNCAGTGALGLDTGSLANNTFYSVYAIYKPSTNTWSVMACTQAVSNAEVYAGANLPAGYTASAYIGWFLTDGSAHIKNFTQLGRKTWFPTTNALSITASVPTTFTSVSISAIVPTKAKTIGGTGGNPAAAGYSFALAGDSSGTGEKIFIFSPSVAVAFPTDSFSSGASPYDDLPMITAQTFYYKSHGATVAVRVDISSCTF